jgi:hypothetical protein
VQLQKANGSVKLWCAQGKVVQLDINSQTPGAPVVATAADCCAACVANPQVSSIIVCAYVRRMRDHIKSTSRQSCTLVPVPKELSLTMSQHSQGLIRRGPFFIRPLVFQGQWRTTAQSSCICMCPFLQLGQSCLPRTEKQRCDQHCLEVCCRAYP